MQDKKIRRGRALAMGACALLGACASGVSIDESWVQGYPGARRAPDQVATIIKGWGQGFPSQIDGVNYGSYRGLQLNGIEILPGEHLVTLECDKTRRYTGTKFATPSARGQFVAGHVYRASCRDNGNSASAVVEDLGDGPQVLRAPRPAAR